MHRPTFKLLKLTLKHVFKMAHWLDHFDWMTMTPQVIGRSTLHRSAVRALGHQSVLKSSRHPSSRYLPDSPPLLSSLSFLSPPTLHPWIKHHFASKLACHFLSALVP